MIDLNLLRICKFRKDFFKVRGRIPDAALDPQTRAILSDFEHYFKTFPDDERIDFATFLPIFRARHPTLNNEQSAAYDSILSNAMTVDLSEDQTKGIMRSVLELRLGTDIAGLLAKFDAGDLPNIGAALAAALDEFKADAEIREVDYITDDISDLLAEEEAGAGLHWRLGCLNECVRPLRPGDAVIVAARPDRGKTTFLASELTHMAGQLPPERGILWLNNEGPGKRIIPRLYQAALGATLDQLVEYSRRGVLKDMYAAAVGAIDRIKIVDIHNMDNFTVEGIVEKYNPGVVVFDMIDNIRGFVDAARTDLGLERMYQWARELAVRIEAVSIATSQISADGAGLQFPTDHMLKDSKTGKQGACDLIIMIGAVDDPGYANARFIGTPKSKLRRPGKPGDPRATVRFDAQRARFEDIPVTAEAPGE